MAAGNSLNMDTTGIQSYSATTGDVSASTVTNHGVVVGSGTTALTSTATGSSGQILRSGGASSDPSYSTATYPSTAGTSGNVLTSDGTNWISSAPSGGTAGYCLFISGESGNNVPLDATTYNLIIGGDLITSTTDGAVISRLYIPQSGTITKCYGVLVNSGLLGSSETSTILIRVNATTNNTVTSSLRTDSAENPFNNSSLSISVTAGDYIAIRWTTPTWSSNPTNINGSVSVFIAT